MKDLEREELKESIKENIFYALKNKKNEALKISFRFKGSHQGSSFTFRESIDYFAGSFTYKGVYLETHTVDVDTIVKIILDNFCYDCFAFIDCIEKYGKVECHGFGDYWGKDTFTFIYKRINCI